MPPQAVSPMIVFLASILSFPRASSFIVPFIGANSVTRNKMITSNVVLMMADTPNRGDQGMSCCTWSPQDLTKDSPGFLPIPDDDYVKKYQQIPALWPVEFFIIVYRRKRSKKTEKCQTQILVRESANGTSQWGVGTGVPATRWMLSSAQETPPPGYRWSEPPPSSIREPSSIEEPATTTFEARYFPEFPKNAHQSWAYRKIDICENAFSNPDAPELNDPELEEYAKKIRNDLKTELSRRMEDEEGMTSWESSRTSLVKQIVDNVNSVAAIQGTLRMSGLFAPRESFAGGDAPSRRYVSLGKQAPDHTKLALSTRIFTMFPQMPDPMPLPSATPEDLKNEIKSREFRMAKSGRDPHKDKYGRKFTHKSTSNVSNTIHGVYFTLDATGLPGIDEVPALDLFGTKTIKREWKSLEDLKVLDVDGKNISTEDTKPTFISGFIVRQLVKDGVINIKC